MTSVAELEKLALDLPEHERGALAARLLESLSPVLQDEDEGITEARQRDAELEGHLIAGMSLEELDQRVEQRRQ